MVLQHNMAALNAGRHGAVSNTKISKNLEKLSSGYKINRSADDAAGLAISEKMRGQIRGLSMASQNTDNAISLIQTAEGGLNETHSILARMRELAVQSANGTYQDEDRTHIDSEMQALKDELDRIANSTHFNGIKLLDGSLGGVKGENLSGTAPCEDGTLGALAQALGEVGFPVVFNGNNLNTDITLTSYASAFDGQSANLVVTSGAETGGEARVTLQVGDKTYIADILGNNSYQTEDGTTISTASSDDPYTYVFLDENGMAMAVLNMAVSGVGELMLTNGASGVIANIPMADKNDGTDLLQQTTNAATTPLSDTHPLFKSLIANENSELVFQIGANGTADQRVGLSVPNMSSSNLGTKIETQYNKSGTVGGVSAATREAANDAINIIDAAVNLVSGVRADLGALQNRLEHTSNNLGVTRENLQAAESIIRDVDMAKEMMDFTKNNILNQASQAMLAQANQLPQGVLSLLR